MADHLQAVKQAFAEFKKTLKNLSQRRKKVLADFRRRLEEEKLDSLREKLKN